jgi:mannosyltransferase OCH1-like enzyme
MKNIIIYITSRVIKLLANLAKLLCYVFHAINKNKRFTLPKQSAPILKSSDQPLIPKILWQTNYTNRVTLAVYLNYLFNRIMAYDYEYRFMITEDRSDFIKAHYSADIFNNYSKIQIGAAQADFWRVLVLQKHGGIYLDIDANFVWPLNSILANNPAELYLTIRNGEISNYFIASKPNNPHLDQMASIIMKNINENTIKNVYLFTGPGVFNQVLDKSQVNTRKFSYICNQGNFTNEYFQYIDKAEGKWTKAQKTIDIVKQ